MSTRIWFCLVVTSELNAVAILLFAHEMHAVVEVVELGLFQASSRPTLTACNTFCHCNYAGFARKCWENLSV